MDTEGARQLLLAEGERLPALRQATERLVGARRHRVEDQARLGRRRVG